MICLHQNMAARDHGGLLLYTKYVLKKVILWMQRMHQRHETRV